MCSITFPSIYGTFLLTVQFDKMKIHQPVFPNKTNDQQKVHFQIVNCMTYCLMVSLIRFYFDWKLEKFHSWAYFDCPITTDNGYSEQFFLFPWFCKSCIFCYLFLWFFPLYTIHISLIHISILFMDFHLYGFILLPCALCIFLY